jgi:hypothetical protein
LNRSQILNRVSKALLRDGRNVSVQQIAQGVNYSPVACPLEFLEPSSDLVVVARMSLNEGVIAKKEV